MGSLALLPLAACGQKAATLPTSSQASVVAAKAAAESQGSVWLVESPTTRMYLCGTIHLLRSGDYPLPVVYDRAYADSTRLIFELPPGTARDPKLAQKMQAEGSYPAGQAALSESVKPGTWDALVRWASDRELNAGAFNRYRPWFVALTVSATEYAALGAEPDRGVDQLFEKRAEKDRKPGEGLETLDLQMGLFTTLTEAQQQELLEQTLAEVKSLPAQFQKMITAWRGGDAETLHQMLFEEAEKYPELLDTFLTQRNRRWMKTLEERLAGKEHVMVLVGTGHLGGKGGLIDLLQSKNYKVRKLAEAASAVAR